MRSRQPLSGVCGWAELVDWARRSVSSCRSRSHGIASRMTLSRGQATSCASCGSYVRRLQVDSVESRPRHGAVLQLTPNCAIDSLSRYSKQAPKRRLSEFPHLCSFGLYPQPFSVSRQAKRDTDPRHTNPLFQLGCGQPKISSTVSSAFRASFDFASH